MTFGKERVSNTRYEDFRNSSLHRQKMSRSKITLLPSRTAGKSGRTISACGHIVWMSRSRRGARIEKRNDGRTCGNYGDGFGVLSGVPSSSDLFGICLSKSARI